MLSRWRYAERHIRAAQRWSGVVFASAAWRSTNPANMCRCCCGVNIIEASRARRLCRRPPTSARAPAPSARVPELMQILLRGLNRPLARPSPAPSSSSPSPTPSASASSSAEWIPVLDGAHARSPSPVLTPALRPSSPPWPVRRDRSEATGEHALSKRRARVHVRHEEDPRAERKSERERGEGREERRGKIDDVAF